MRSPLVQLLTARRFAPLFVTQFLGAFNDNLLKSAMGIVVTFRLAEQSGLDSASLVMLAGAVFIAPFFLFSGASGTLADRVDKALIARMVKVAEIGIMTLGALGLWLESVPLLFAALFCLGTHSTVFGPIKYALLPQHLREDELVAGNALIEAGTFLAILLGTILGGSVVLLANGALIVGGCGVVSALLGWLAARQIPPAPSSAADAPRPRLLRDTIAVVGHVTSRPALLLPILAVSWFWLFGATVVSGLPAFAKDVLFANEQVVTMMLALFAVGVGVGSIVAERLLHGEVSARLRAGRGRGDGVLRLGSARGQRRPPVDRRTCDAYRPSCARREAGASSSIWSASRWRAVSSPCRSTRSCSTKASRRIARA